MKIMDHIHPKVMFLILLPIIKRITGTIVNSSVLGNLAAKLLIPNILKEI